MEVAGEGTCTGGMDEEEDCEDDADEDESKLRMLLNGTLLLGRMKDIQGGRVVKRKRARRGIFNHIDNSERQLYTTILHFSHFTLY